MKKIIELIIITIILTFIYKLISFEITVIIALSIIMQEVGGKYE